jgi:uncharacterized protein with NAD-binding domain and iron-sulfur cluster
MPEQGATGGITRRRFVRDAGVATIAAADLMAGPAVAAQRHLRPSRRPTVAVFGGGVAGLTAAQELVERGFDVTVYERRVWGGKARSIDVPQSAMGGRKPLPAEHGYREVFAGYQNLPDTMRRIPFASNRDGVFGNLVTAPLFGMVVRDRGRAPFTVPGGAAGASAMTPVQAVDLLIMSLSWMPPTDVAHVVSRIVVFLSSGQARRYRQWEHTTWADFVQADRFTEGGRLVWVNFPTRFAAQSLAGQTSARTIGQVAESVLVPVVEGRDVTRVLDAPTNEVWIDPWVTHLRGLGVRMRLGYKVTALASRHGRITHATVRGPHGTRTVHADWYVVALPVDWATKLWTRDIVAADPQLARSFNITGGWMTGIQLYLHAPTPIAAGPVACLDSPWAISGISQAQFWKGRDFAASYGDGTVRDKFSALIVDWDTPGILYGKKARDCTQAEIAAEVWAQIKAHFTYPGAPSITDDLLAGTFLDPGIRWKHGRITGYDDPLPQSNPGSWYDRPEVASKIPNLFLAGDYVKVDFDISSMEGANEAARRAVNALLERAGSQHTPVRVYNAHLPPEWSALRDLDDQRYARGQPNLFDADLSLEQIKQILRQPIDKLISPRTGLHAIGRST